MAGGRWAVWWWGGEGKAQVALLHVSKAYTGRSLDDDEQKLLPAALGSRQAKCSFSSPQLPFPKEE